MDALAECLNGFDQVGILVEERQWLPLAQVLDLTQVDGLALSGASGQFDEIVLVWLVFGRS
jgi:hypothetical protein